MPIRNLGIFALITSLFLSCANKKEYQVKYEIFLLEPSKAKYYVSYKDRSGKKQVFVEENWQQSVTLPSRDMASLVVFKAEAYERKEIWIDKRLAYPILGSIYVDDKKIEQQKGEIITMTYFLD